MSDTNEPQRFWSHGYECETRMGRFSINGYVTLPEEHPWLQDGDLIMNPSVDVDVHGGITYHHGRMIGFDTAHFGDGWHPEAPGTISARKQGTLLFYGQVWSRDAVRAETIYLAGQAAQAEQEARP